MPFLIQTDGLIQYSNTIAIDNGMMLKVLFQQLKGIRAKIHIPLLMGYINPAMQYGMENFLKMHHCGIDGIIIPDLPMYEYEQIYKVSLKISIRKYILITPETSIERIQKIDEHQFLYLCSFF